MMMYHDATGDADDDDDGADMLHWMALQLEGTPRESHGKEALNEGMHINIYFEVHN